MHYCSAQNKHPRPANSVPLPFLQRPRQQHPLEPREQCPSERRGARARALLDGAQRGLSALNTLLFALPGTGVQKHLSAARPPLADLRGGAQKVPFLFLLAGRIGLEAGGHGRSGRARRPGQTR